MDDNFNPYTPLLYTSPRPGAARRDITAVTVFVFAVLVLAILNFFITIEAISYSYQALFTSGARLLALTPTDKLVECKTWRRTEHAPPSIPGTALWPWEIAEFDVPIDERGLFVLARGSSSSGIVQVRESPDVKDLKVSVSVHYDNEEALSSARYCLMEREDGGHGVALVTPFRWIAPNQKKKLFFVVNVTFPSPTYGVSHLPGFTINVPDFALEIDDLSAFNFDAFTLKSTNSPINIKSIAGQTVVVEGKNGKISGSFNATRLLTLSTTNDAIEASGHLHNAHRQPGQPTIISLKTTNGALHSNISLSSSSSNAASQRGSFRVSAQTTNAPLDIALSSNARPVLLRLDAATHNAPAHVTLPPAFEGRFLLRTTRFRPTLHETPRVAGHARRLISTGTVAGHAMVGNVSWVLREHEQGDADADLGWASVSTSGAPATLVL